MLLTHLAFAQSNSLVTESAPLYPGETTYVYFVVNNTGFGNGFLNDVSVRLEPKDNASANAVTILDETYSLGTIQDWGDQRTAKIKIHVNPGAAEGDYFFNVYITFKGQQISSSTPAPIVSTEIKDQILTIKGTPVVVLLNSTLGIIAPMSVNNETLRFKNTGTGTVQNAVAEIGTNTNTNSVFSILGGGTKFSLGNLKPGDEADITFDLAVDITATPGAYNLPVTITGMNNYSSDNFAGLVVAGTTDFEISYQETLGSFSLNVANVGVNPASAVTVSLPQQKNFTTVGSSSSVLGSLNPGDYTSAIFQITKNPGGGNILDIVIQYTDTSGMRHAITKSLAVQLSAGAQTGAGRGSALYTTWVPVIAIILLALYWQRRKITTYFHKPEGNK
ncbi:MAG: hypothetical protein O8C68_09410 [Candidatus Methanoperedens sp.]|nr:hypothetical protein [Candidatus Methanoperedens sp.]MCZ7396017.1 hypothetical protein [Candidatus Methanoperedens sp.]